MSSSSFPNRSPPRKLRSELSVCAYVCACVHVCVCECMCVYVCVRVCVFAVRNSKFVPLTSFSTCFWAQVFEVKEIVGFA